jgi:single-stranded DNA-specific DHH superfamily exonuclease
MLTKNEINKIKDALNTCKRPIYFFDDDPDGLASFLLLYRYTKEGQGFPVKAQPKITKKTYADKVKEYEADCVFILDIATVDQDFVDTVKVPVYWIDHHEIKEIQNVNYFNSLKNGENIPTSALCWQVVQNERLEDLWIAIVGCIGDWYVPSFAEIFQQSYPSLLPDYADSPEKALFETEFGKLIKIFSFIMKGTNKEVKQSIKTLTRINNPYDILGQQSPAGIYIYKHYKKINTEYEQLLSTALKTKEEDNTIIFTYTANKISLTKDLSNELLYRFKNKIIILAREKSGEMKCSIRSPKKINIHAKLQKAMQGIEGHFGGHENACGAIIKQNDFKKFIKQLKEELN